MQLLSMNYSEHSATSNRTITWINQDYNPVVKQIDRVPNPIFQLQNNIFYALHTFL